MMRLYGLLQDSDKIIHAFIEYDYKKGNVIVYGETGKNYTIIGHEKVLFSDVQNMAIDQFSEATQTITIFQNGI